MRRYFGGSSSRIVLFVKQKEDQVAVIKTYTVSVVYARNDEETLDLTDIAYLHLRDLIAKLISQSVEISMGEIGAHISGSVIET